jgi:hypothetical protein
MSYTTTTTQVQKALGKRGQAPAAIATKLGRPTGKGLGPILARLVGDGVAVRNEDGTYSKAV